MLVAGLGTKEMMAPGSEEVACSRCGRMCWVAPSTKAIRDRGAKIICLVCFFETYEEGAIHLAEGSLQEISQLLGRPYTPQDFVMMVADLKRAIRQRRSER